MLEVLPTVPATKRHWFGESRLRLRAPLQPFLGASRFFRVRLLWIMDRVEDRFCLFFLLGAGRCRLRLRVASKVFWGPSSKTYVSWHAAFYLESVSPKP